MDSTIWIALSTGVGIMVAIGTFIGIWIRLGSRLTSNQLTADAAGKTADLARVEIAQLATTVSDQRETNARDFGRLTAFNEGVIKAMEASDRRLTGAVAEMTDSIRYLTARFDRFIDRMPNSITDPPKT